jgi:transcription elongation factor GreA
LTDTVTSPNSQSSKSSYLTTEAYNRLKAELAQMTGPGRSELAKKIEAARDEGDLKENGGYHAAKEEQGKMEARIRQLTQLLENAKVGETPKDSGIVTPGMLITVRMFGDEETFLLGHREIKDDNGPEVFSEQSPLGKAINGKKVGVSATYETPNGKKVEVTILKAAPYTG